MESKVLKSNIYKYILLQPVDIVWIEWLSRILFGSVTYKIIETYKNSSLKVLCNLFREWSYLLHTQSILHYFMQIIIVSKKMWNIIFVFNNLFNITVTN